MTEIQLIFVEKLFEMIKIHCNHQSKEVQQKIINFAEDMCLLLDGQQNFPFCVIHEGKRPEHESYSGTLHRLKQQEAEKWIRDFAILNNGTAPWFVPQPVEFDNKKLK